MKVYVRGMKDRLECKVLKENINTIWVKLPNGDVIKRHLKKDIKKGEIIINKYKPEVKNATTPVTDTQDDEGSSEKG